jgi:hypothetical protein
MNEMRRMLLFPLAVLLTPGALEAQATGDRAAFVTMLGNDTIAVERFTRTADGMRAEVALRVPQTTLRTYVLRHGPAGQPATMEVLTHDPVAGLSAAPQQRQQVELAAGARFPFIDMVHWPFELAFRQAVTAGVRNDTVPLAAGQRTVAFRLAQAGDGAYTFAHPSRGTMDVRVDEHGGIVELDASQTTRKLRVVRRPDVDVAAIARGFAAHEARHGPAGELSGRGSAEAVVRGASLEVDYGVPLKRGREVYGALVPWEQVWRTGANRATHFSTDRDLAIGGRTLPAGSYTLFTIPRPDEWTLIVNRRTDINGQAHDPAHDLFRVPMRTRPLPETVEAFTIRVDEEGAGGVLRLQWDRTEAYVPFEVRGG